MEPKMASRAALSLEDIERMNRSAVDRMASEADCMDAILTDPVYDIDIFSEHIPGKRMLDVGCGTSRYAGRFIEKGLEYVGIDLSPLMVEVSKKRNPDSLFSAMSFRRLSFPDESFDGLWCCCSLGYEPKRNIAQVLKELRRVLVKNGILFVVMPDIEVSDEEINDHDDGEAIYYSLYFPDEFHEELERAGFRVEKQIRRFKNGSASFLARK